MGFFDEETVIKTLVKENPSNQENNYETILLFGQPKEGKTFAACSFIEMTIKNGGRAYIINNDNGVYRTALAYFGNNIGFFSQNTVIYSAVNMDNIFDIVEELNKIITSKDILVIDLIDEFYEMAQEKFVDSICKGLNINIVDYITLAAKETDKFGILDAQKWQYVKKLDSILLRKLVIYPKCNVIACCGAKDLDVRRLYAKKTKDTEKKEELLEELNKYSEIGCVPAGHKNLAYKFNTVIFIGEEKGKHVFMVTGDRGYMKSKSKIYYDRNFYEEFIKLRK